MDIILLFLGVLVSLVSSGNTIAREKPRKSEYYVDFFNYFINEAPLYDANYAKNFTSNIPWADVNLLKQSADFHRKNYVGLSIMQLNTQIEVLALKSTSSVLLTTKSYDDIPRAYHRSLQTLLYMKALCLSGAEILDPNSDAGKTLTLIRQRHRSAAYLSENRTLEAIDSRHGNSLQDSFSKKDVYPESDLKRLVWALRSDLESVDTSEAPKNISLWDWTKPVSHFDLGVAQFLWYGHILFRRQKFGIYFEKEEEAKSYVHLWAVLGRMLGLEDRFNVALHLPYQDHARFYRHIIVAAFKNADERNVRQMANTMEGMYRDFLVPTAMRLKCWIFYYIKDAIPEFEGRNMLTIMDLEDMICLKYIGVVATSPINLSLIFKTVSRLTFDSWLQQELKRLNIKYEY